MYGAYFSNLLEFYAHFLRIMKLSVFLILIGISNLFASTSYSQETHLSIHLKNGTIKELFEQIQKQSEFILFYKDSQLDIGKKLNVVFEKATVQQILEKVFENTTVRFDIIDRQIVIHSIKEPEVLANVDESHVIQEPNTRIIKGKVSDIKGGGIPGVSVLVKGTSIGIITENSGNFLLKIPTDAKVLTFSFVGMKSQEIGIGEKSLINVVLEEETVGIEEVVAVGYSRQSQVTITGSVSSIKSDELKSISAPTMGEGILGKVAGIQMTQVAGTPGESDPTMFIRGIGTLNQTDPLFIIDGVPNSQRAFMQLNPSSILQMSILKDASATAVYGVRGANGVIIVETKRGGIGAAKIDASISTGFQQPTQLMDFANSYQWATAYNELLTNDGSTNNFITDDQLKHYQTNDQPIIYPSKLWVGEILNNVAAESRANVNISGGTKDIRYYTSLSYFHQDGLIKQYGPAMENFGYDRYNLQTNIDVNITKSTTLSFTTRARYGLRTEPLPVGTVTMATLWSRLYNIPPMTSLGLIDDKLVVPDSRYLPAPVAFREESFVQNLYKGDYRKVTENLFDFNFDFVQKFGDLFPALEGLSFRTKMGYRAGFDRNKLILGGNNALYIAKYNSDAAVPNSDLSDTDVVLQKSGVNTTKSWSTWYAPDRYMYLEAGFEYLKSFNNHNVSALFLYNQNKDYFPPSSWNYSNIPTGNVGLVGRVTYNYKSRYLIEGNVGYNGSENFAKGKRFGIFPSVSGGWVVSEENFMKEISFISYLKLRASYGIVGNDQAGGASRFIYIGDSYNRNVNQYYGYNFGDNIPQFQPGVNEAKVGNKDVTWETATKQNYGLDIIFLNNSLTLNVDYAYEYRNNILSFRQSAPGFLAMDLPAVNIGEMENKGFEINLSYQGKIGDLKYMLNGNISRFVNKVLFMDELPPVEPYQTRTGHSVNSFYGYVWEGYYTAEEEAAINSEIEQGIAPSERTIAVPTGAFVKAGDMKYKDLNEDGIIDDIDTKVIGNPFYPQITAGLNGNLLYKNFDLNFGFQGAAEVSRIIEYRLPMGGSNTNSLWLPIYEGYWTPERAAAGTVEWPRLTQTNKAYNANASTFWVRDASYFRLKRAELGYTFTGIRGIDQLRVFVSGTNLFTLQKKEYKWSDPEVQNQAYPLLKMYNIGLQVNF